MGKRGSNKKAPPATAKAKASMTLREESSGRKQTHVNPKSMLKLEHLRNIALWASGEASIPPLGAFFGQKLASCAEALGAPPDHSLFLCQRCETVMQPGYNCTVRIQKNETRGQCKKKKQSSFPQNFVVYKCNFCSHRNMKRGTTRGYVKQLCPLDDAKPPSDRNPAKVASGKSAILEKAETRHCEDSRMDPTAALQAVGNEICMESPDPAKVASGESAILEKAETRHCEHSRMDPTASLQAVGNEIRIESPAAPAVKVSLLDSKKRKRRMSESKTAKVESSSAISDSQTNASSKRKRKTWASLQEIVESNDHDSNQKFCNSSIPFLL